MPDPPRAAKPTKEVFDVFHSSGTGHQRAENRLAGSTSWRDSRTLKLREQFSAGTGGGKRVQDTIGAGSFHFQKKRLARDYGSTDLNLGEQDRISDRLTIAKDVERPAKRQRVETTASQSIIQENKKTPVRSKGASRRRVSSQDAFEPSPSDLLSPIDPNSSNPDQPTSQHGEDPEYALEEKQYPQIFTNVNVYINGSTAPLISDHKLKHLLSSHGGKTSIGLGRQTVTHVIIGRPNSNGGCGGGLAGSKIQKEIATTGKSVKFVTAEWVIESVKAGKRLPESQFEAVRMAPKRMGSVASMFGRQKKSVPDRKREDKGG